MTQKKLACIILAAGQGKRMASALPKALHRVAGRSMIAHSIAAAESLNPEKIVVTAPGAADMAEAVKPHTVAVQRAPDGTGGATLAAKDALAGFRGDVLILYSDSPLVTPESLARMVELRRQLPAAGLVYAGARPADASAYGRMVMDEDGTLKKIVEFRDASAEEKKIGLVYAGFVCADGEKLFGWLSQITNDNAAKEYYLTDLPQIARRDNRTTHVLEIPAEEMLGANTRVELAALESVMQDRLRKKHMLAGATLTDPASVFFCADTVIGRDVTIGPNVVFGPGVSVADNVDILPFCHIEGAVLESGARAGPFARLRPGTRLGRGAHVGTFVETKNAQLHAGAKANHLAYLGDADVGEGANIGAGTITCNYDGFDKHRTSVGKGAFIGSNTALVAPVSVGDGAYVGAGSTITRDVPEGALALTRPAQENKRDWAERFRAAKEKRQK